MRHVRFSLRGFLIFSLIAFLTFVALFEKNRADRLESIIRQPIREQEFVVEKRRLALEYSSNGLETTLQQMNLPEIELDGEPTTILPLGMRREMSNIRNAKLKLDREEAKLEAMKSSIDF